VQQGEDPQRAVHGDGPISMLGCLPCVHPACVDQATAAR
jgi:hypothetical protein